MSANLLDGIKPRLTHGTTESDGIFHHAAGKATNSSHDDWLTWDLPDQAALATNQTYHIGLSVRGTSANGTSLRVTIGYKDAAEKKNYVTSSALAIGTSWGRVERTLVVPSGMRPFAFCVTAYGTYPEVWMAAPTLSLGSPVTLASSAHTPYATQNHVMVTYATKASLKITDDSIKAEVSARAQTDRNVADLSSRVTQTANSLTSEISDRRDAITTVTGLANAAQSTADAAKTSASSAMSTANSASTSASNAVKTANSASSSAASAVKTANSASTAAGKASTDAAAAVKTANSASSTANGAATTANSAKSTADAAKSTATAAQTMATENRSSIKQLSTSITSEVSARTKTDRMVSEVSSRLTQTADGFSASIDRLSGTDKKVNSWFDFGADSSGNPQLTMGSSTSPVVGVYTNAGLAYKARSGATLLELDGASRSSTMPHVYADDVSMGSWQLGPTQGGTHFTLQWIGG